MEHVLTLSYLHYSLAWVVNLLLADCTNSTCGLRMLSSTTIRRNSIYMLFYDVFKLLLFQLVESNYGALLTSIIISLRRCWVGDHRLLLGLDLYHVFRVEGTCFYIIINALVRQTILCSWKRLSRNVWSSPEVKPLIAWTFDSLTRLLNLRTQRPSYVFLLPYVANKDDD